MEKIKAMTVRLDAKTAARLEAMQAEKKMSAVEVIKSLINNEHSELFDTVRHLGRNNNDILALLKMFLPQVSTKGDVRESTDINTRSAKLFHTETVKSLSAELSKVSKVIDTINTDVVDTYNLVNKRVK
jgi:hypothetical protein